MYLSACACVGMPLSAHRFIAAGKKQGVRQDYEDQESSGRHTVVTTNTHIVACRRSGWLLPRSRWILLHVGYSKDVDVGQNDSEQVCKSTIHTRDLSQIDFEIEIESAEDLLRPDAERRRWDRPK